MKEVTCPECGLPFGACNALAMYRKSVDYYRRGKSVEGDQFAESAKELYDAFRDAQRNPLPTP